MNDNVPPDDASVHETPQASAPEEMPAIEMTPVETPAAETPPMEAPAADVPAPAPPDPALEERRRRAREAWDRVVSAHAGGNVVSGFVTAAVKGGLLVDMNGIRGFLPASQVRASDGAAIESLVRTKISLKILDIDGTRRRAVVSQRRALEEERRAKRTALLQSLQIGQRREAVVVRLTDFGAFVDLGGVDALIPMSELALERVDKAADAVTIGETVTAEVLRIDEGGKKIALSRKNVLPDPWRDRADLLRPGAVADGTVVAKEPRLHIELAPGIVGTIREGDANPADYEVGENVEVTVRSIDRRMRRILLTTMTAEAAPQTSSGFAPLGVELQRRPPPARR